MKLKCAKKALEFIEDGMTVGLGGGSTVALLIQEIEKEKKKIQAVTPSFDTRELCIEHHIPVAPLEMMDKIDVAFDGCDELDMKLNALKSCGGIHTREKLVAAMAEKYILLADEGKLKDKLEFGYPVTLEVLTCARAYVKKCLEEMGAEVTERRSEQKTGLVISDDGNYLMEAKFSEVENAEVLSDTLNRMPGIVGHSLFCNVAEAAIIVKTDGIGIIGEITEKENV